MNDDTDSGKRRDLDRPESGAPVEAPRDLPKFIGRYRVQRLLGEGGFGLVYLAFDEQLNRPVAVKVPHKRLVSHPGDARAYLDEARTVANLDHPNIVPVHDVGGTEEFPFYVVSRFIDGENLATRVGRERPSPPQATNLVATVAEALQFAHSNGLVHRDIKPGNILIDRGGKPFVVDFGLALREQDLGKGPRHAGTPAYMSPEQARGEGHRVDGRSDIFSLGIVYYEILTGRRPFRGDSDKQVMEEIINSEPRPPRQLDDAIPKELERICLKALAKRVGERYAKAGDMADDLRHWLLPLTGGHTTAGVGPEPAGPGVAEWPAAADPGKDAFLSYATPDKEAAYRLCRSLEGRGVSCWIAPRDVQLGDDYGAAIIRAIEGTGTILLLLSAHANASVHVTHEVERATSKRKRVIPVRLEDVEPSPSLELHIAAAHRVDAWRLPPDQMAEQLALVIRKGASRPTPPPRPAEVSPLPSPPDQRPWKLIPKGLRSFDEHDAGFFLELLPGPRDRDGLPDGLRFWKIRIEERDADRAFPVGLIFGPSGCGKSSLVKAGLLPRLGGQVLSVYVEATAGETEARMLRGLRKVCPSLPGDRDLVDSLADLRRGRCLRAGQKVLLVVDQFEQWLLARRGEVNPELVDGLRQCDGENLQAVVLVRDDFWMAATRFMTELEIDLVPDRNVAAVDLFDIRHAHKVLRAFGQAYGALPEKHGDLTRDQQDFLGRAITGLAQDGKVISVRLALFAEMMKDKPWTPATLRAVGGTEGVGRTFLEESFYSPKANPGHRLHQNAARAVLKALLPDDGTDIKGRMRHEEGLRKASGYSDRPKAFDDLIRILGAELRLITLTDPEGSAGDGQPATPSGGRYFQLTHDYLVHSLRDWLNSKERETYRGRAGLCLAERSALWNARPENRHLPSPLEWARIRVLTRAKGWTDPQRRMMNRAAWIHGVLGFLILSGLVGVVYAGLEVQARGLVQQLVHAEIAEVPGIISDIPGYRWVVDRVLREQYRKAPEGTPQRLHCSLALLPVDPGQVEYLYSRMLRAGPTESVVIRDSLGALGGALVEGLWRVLDRPAKGEKGQCLQAAAALALYDPDDPRWANVSANVADELVSVNAAFLGDWMKALRPVRDRITPPLAATFRDKTRSESERNQAADVLAEYAGEKPYLMADLLMEADSPKPFDVLFRKLRAHGKQALDLLETELTKKPSDGTGAETSRLAGRQARASVAVLRLGRPEGVWRLLRHNPDPGVRSHVVNLLKPLGTDLGTLVAGLGATNPASAPLPFEGRRTTEAHLFHPENSLRRALVLALGEYGAEELAPDERGPLVENLLEIYRNDPDAGIHGSAEWTLRRWKQGEKLDAADAALRGKDKDRGNRRWFVTSEGQTMAMIEGRVVFPMGAPTTEPDRDPDEVLHLQWVNRDFAIATKEVDVEQFQRFLKSKIVTSHTYKKKYSPEPHCPQTSVTWYEAAAYCDWLSRQEGLKSCYKPIKEGKYAEGMTIVPGSLDRSGYRLPTEAEWEYACRAGAVTSRYYGNPAELLKEYAWHLHNADDHTWPCGQLKPNDLGLFDLLGNVSEWCQDEYLAYAAVGGLGASELANHGHVVHDKTHRTLRGGAYSDIPANTRSAERFRDLPSFPYDTVGFRLARTYP